MLSDASAVERRKHVAPFGSERQRVHTQDGSEIQTCVKVRKERAAARRLPSQPVAQPCGVNAHQQQVALTGEMFCSGFHHLCGAGEMDEAILLIDRRAMEDALL